MPNWIFVGRRGDYYIWSHHVAHRQYPKNMVESVYQATETDSPPTSEGGYYSLDSLLKLKGVQA